MVMIPQAMGEYLCRNCRSRLQQSATSPRVEAHAGAKIPCCSPSALEYGRVAHEQALRSRHLSPRSMHTRRPVASDRRDVW